MIDLFYQITASTLSIAVMIFIWPVGFGILAAIIQTVTNIREPVIGFSAKLIGLIIGIMLNYKIVSDVLVKSTLALWQ